jgi:hypothetical protein
MKVNERKNKNNSEKSIKLTNELNEVTVYKTDHENQLCSVSNE